MGRNISCIWQHDREVDIGGISSAFWGLPIVLTFVEEERELSALVNGLTYPALDMSCAEKTSPLNRRRGVFITGLFSKGALPIP